MMSPGAERSLMRLGDDLPKLINSIHELAAVLTNRNDCEPTTEKGITLKITLSDEEWGELANALSVRAMQIKEEDPSEDMTQKDINAWAASLESCYEKISSILEQNHITY